MRANSCHVTSWTALAAFMFTACASAVLASSSSGQVDTRFQPLLEILAEHEANRTQPTVQISHVALLKTHKTASSTLASVLFRYAARHNLRMFAMGPGTVMPSMYVKRLASFVPKSRLHKFDMLFQHLSGMDTLGVNMPGVFRMFEGLIDNPRVITIVREPMKHALSWACYMRTPQNLKSLYKIVDSNSLPSNTLAADFGITTRDQLDKFLATDFSRFELVCITELFQECLVMLMRRFGWSLLDITALSILESSGHMFDLHVCL
jgi:hypothetical protein